MNSIILLSATTIHLSAKSPISLSLSFLLSNTILIAFFLMGSCLLLASLLSDGSLISS